MVVSTVKADNQELHNAMQMVYNKQRQLEDTIKHLVSEKAAGEKYVQQVTVEKNWLQKRLQFINEEQLKLKEADKKYSTENSKLMKGIVRPNIAEGESGHKLAIMSHLQELIE